MQLSKEWIDWVIEWKPLKGNLLGKINQVTPQEFQTSRKIKFLTPGRLVLTRTSDLPSAR